MIDVNFIIVINFVQTDFLMQPYLILKGPFAEGLTVSMPKGLSLDAKLYLESNTVCLTCPETSEFRLEVPIADGQPRGTIWSGSVCKWDSVDGVTLLHSPSVSNFRVTLDTRLLQRMADYRRRERDLLQILARDYARYELNA